MTSTLTVGQFASIKIDYTHSVTWVCADTEFDGRCSAFPFMGTATFPRVSWLSFNTWTTVNFSDAEQLLLITSPDSRVLAPSNRAVSIINTGSNDVGGVQVDYRKDEAWIPVPTGHLNQYWHDVTIEPDRGTVTGIRVECHVNTDGTSGKCSELAQATTNIPKLEGVLVEYRITSLPTERAGSLFGEFRVSYDIE